MLLLGKGLKGGGHSSAKIIGLLMDIFCSTPTSYVINAHTHTQFVRDTVPGRQGRQKIIPQKNAEKINKFIKYFVEINKNYRQKNKGKRVAASKI
jgi:hypothetical protein